MRAFILVIGATLAACHCVPAYYSCTCEQTCNGATTTKSNAFCAEDEDAAAESAEYSCENSCTGEVTCRACTCRESDVDAPCKNTCG